MFTASTSARDTQARAARTRMTGGPTRPPCYAPDPLMDRPLLVHDLVERDHLIRPAVELLLGAGAPSPGLIARGVLFVGPSAGGTSAVAYAVATEVGEALGAVVDWPRRAPATFDPDADVAVVDDIHVVDHPARLADWVEATPSRRIIATAHEGGALAPALNTLWSSGRLQRVDVPRLTSTGVERMATALLGGAVTRGLTEYLFAASNGLPLYVRELLADGTNDGTVIRSGGAWVWWGDATHVGPRVRDLVRGRIGMVSDDERVALELVAVSGGAPLRILRQVVSDDALDSCERRGIVALTPDGDLRMFPPAREPRRRGFVERSAAQLAPRTPQRGDRR